MAEKEGEAELCVSEPVEDFNKLAESLPEGEKHEQVRRLVGKIESGSFSSPVPSPEFMAGYEAVIAGSAKQILTMAVEGQRADNAARDKMIAGQDRFHKYNFIRDIFFGCIFLLIFLAVLAAGLFLILYGHEETALKLWGGGGFVAIICAVLAAYFRHSKAADKNSKKK